MQEKFDPGGYKLEDRGARCARRGPIHYGRCGIDILYAMLKGLAGLLGFALHQP